MLRAKLNLLDQQISRLDQEIIRLHSPDELNEPWNLPFSTMLEFGDSAEEKETVLPGTVWYQAVFIYTFEIVAGIFKPLGYNIVTGEFIV